MTKRTAALGSVLCSALVWGGSGFAQAPVVNIDAQKHANLAGAQRAIVQAYQLIDQAQSANKDQLRGHGERAKQLLAQADAELRQAANVSNAEGR